MLVACNPTANKPSDYSPCYDISLAYDEEGKSISVSQEILFTSPVDLNDIVLHLYANAFDEQHNVIDVLSLQFNRQTLDYEIYGKDRTLLKFLCNMLANETCTISLKYTVKLPNSDTRLGITERGDANLGCFYPALAVYEDGWREDEYAAFGDPFFSETSSFFVSVTLDEELSVAASGRAVEARLFNLDGKRKKSVEIEAENIRDFGMVIGNFEKTEDAISIGDNAVEVEYFYYADENPAGTLARAVNSLKVFSEAFGDYAYDTFTVAQSNLKNAGGMEYGTFVTVSPSPSREIFLDTVTHETAHQWWYNAVGSDQINSAWLDEGLTEFCTYYYHYLTGDRAAYSSGMANMSRSYASFSALKNTVGFDGRMNRPLSSYLTDGEYVAVTYLKGALLFDTLRTLVGDRKFQAALRHYYAAGIYRIATQQDLIAAFKTQGYDVASIINGWTDDTVK